MKELLGLDVIELTACQDRRDLCLKVINESGQVYNIRFSNNDDSKINIDFSHVSLSISWDPETNISSLGELEIVRKIEGEEGYEVIGDFGVIWVWCNPFVPPLDLNS